MLSECRIERFFMPLATLLTKSLNYSFIIADVKEFMSVSIQMMNIRNFPCFTGVADEIISNFNLVRAGQPPNSLSIMTISQDQVKLLFNQEIL